MSTLHIQTCATQLLKDAQTSKAFIKESYPNCVRRIHCEASFIDCNFTIHVHSDPTLKVMLSFFFGGFIASSTYHDVVLRLVSKPCVGRHLDVLRWRVNELVAHPRLRLVNPHRVVFLLMSWPFLLTFKSHMRG